VTTPSREKTGERVFARLGFPLGQDLIIDGKFNQICNDAGTWLLRQHEWPFLRKTSVITTVAGTARYVVSDATEGVGAKTYTCDRLIDDIQWDITNQWRFVGDVGDDIWYSYQYGILTDPLKRLWRTASKTEIEIAPTPTANGERLAVPFITDKWATAVDASAYRAELTTATDLHRYDWDLFDACVQWRLMESLGLDYAPYLAATMDKLGERKASYRNSGTLSLAPRRGTRMLGYCNVPQTGYGS
jgi:hypothetical protein